jgi:hypothetical protein
LTFPESTGGGPELHFQTRVFHPLVDRVSGQVKILGDRGAIAELLEALKAAFENDDVLDQLSEDQVADKEAWKKWNARRDSTDGWTERVAECVKASQDEVKPEKGGEIVLLKGDLAEVEQVAADRIRSSVGERLRERGIRVREY